MNYLWGAVNAISAPYQYYKDINPATLTGAIDVIVIRRPGSNGSTELACSPFHVRFGKWQVLRPSEKKVDITVNGKSVPFSMKIGEAGEAFFVFQTDNDIPEDLITSPLLEPTEPLPSNPQLLGDFGRSVVRDRRGDFTVDGVGQEPDFLDLDAPSTPPSKDLSKSSPTTNITLFRPASLPNEPIPFPSVPPPSTLLQDPPLHPPLPPLQSSATSDEYSWEWGGFPQRSQSHSQYLALSDTAPLKTVHGIDANEETMAGHPVEFQRSKSLPPEFELDPPEGVTPTSNDHFSGQEPLSDVEPVLDHDSGMLDRDRRSWVRWWRRDSKHQRDVDVAFERPSLKSAMSTPLPSEPQRSSSARAPSPDDVMRDALPLPASELQTAGLSTFSGRRPTMRYAKTLRLTSEQLQALDLHPGANTITFSLSLSGVVACTARIFMWEHTESVVVSDIDGTITKSDALGHMFNLIGRDWTHLGVAKLYTDIHKNGYKILYLTSRAIGQADSTRYYLQGIKQNDYQLPAGPVIMSPDRLMASLHREVIMRKPEVFKMACLRDIRGLFGPAAPLPFYAGFGNRITDALSYRSVNIPSSRIFTIDSNGEVKMELLELVGHKSESVRSYIHMTDLVDQMFPPITHKWEMEFTDNNFWKAPLTEFPLPDLTPPSPALSARSDVSNKSAFARLRNFSLRSTASSSRSRAFAPSPPLETRRGRDMDITGAHNHQRQLSSIERLSSVLVGLANRSVSPSTPSAGDSESEEDSDSADFSEHARRRRRLRKRSMGSMPGSLSGSRPSLDEDLEFGVTEAREHGSFSDPAAETVEQELDEDLFAAGEMEKVPFL
ncbi:Lipin/Ned1/Smp2-domain-containing protein [Russula earlei]|uniref:Lipin/Ned1/Smp2-domain-containing protein n=1 Tax=Russula earlei TaxID=71964 RepID=A0ACC0UEK2_9AGAM|nr:Lipin/Ned1/Smp2-domain-containing protein [Russula earlei]